MVYEGHERIRKRKKKKKKNQKRRSRRREREECEESKIGKQSLFKTAGEKFSDFLQSDEKHENMR